MKINMWSEQRQIDVIVVAMIMWIQQETTNSILVIIRSVDWLNSFQFLGGRYYTIVTDPQAYGGIAKEVKRLDFHELSSEVTERAFGFRRIPTKSLPHGGLTHNYLQVHKRKKWIFSSSWIVFKILKKIENKGERLKDMIISTRTNMEQVLTKSKYRKFSDWNKVDLFEFSYEIMFEVVFRTMWVKAA